MTRMNSMPTVNGAGMSGDCTLELDFWMWRIGTNPLGELTASVPAWQVTGGRGTPCVGAVQVERAPLTGELEAGRDHVHYWGRCSNGGLAIAIFRME